MTAENDSLASALADRRARQEAAVTDLRPPMVVVALRCGHRVMFRSRWRPRRGEHLWCARCVGEPAVVSSSAAVSRRQLVALHASLGALGVRVRVDRLRTVSELVGRELGSTSELSRAEARRVIDALKRRVSA